MPNPKRERSPVASPPILIFATALTCGVLAALALQIHLTRSGFDLVGLWTNLLSAKALQLRTAGPWWGIAGLAFAVGGATAAALSRLPWPWRRFRLIRWIASALVVALLADIGDSTAELTGIAPGANVAANLGALALAALMAMFGAYFTARR